MQTRSLVLIAAILAGCAPIQHSAEITQPINSSRMAGPGDIVASVDKQRNMENIFGNASIYGRKTSEGSSELRFLGVENDGTIILSRKDTSIITNETTMSRTPFETSNTFVSGTATGNRNFASVNATATTITDRPPPEYHVVVPGDSIPIRLPKGTSSPPFEGYIVQIQSVTPTAMTYSVVKQ